MTLDYRTGDREDGALGDVLRSAPETREVPTAELRGRILGAIEHDRGSSWVAGRPWAGLAAVAAVVALVGVVVLVRSSPRASQTAPGAFVEVSRGVIGAGDRARDLEQQIRNRAVSVVVVPMRREAEQVRTDARRLVRGLGRVVSGAADLGMGLGRDLGSPT